MAGAAEALRRQTLQQFRRMASLGMSMPSPSSLYDIIKQDLVEKHNGREVSDIWAEVRRQASSGVAEWSPLTLRDH